MNKSQLNTNGAPMPRGKNPQTEGSGQNRALNGRHMKAPPGAPQPLRPDYVNLSPSAARMHQEQGGSRRNIRGGAQQGQDGRLQGMPAETANDRPPVGTQPAPPSGVPQVPYENAPKTSPDALMQNAQLETSQNPHAPVRHRQPRPRGQAPQGKRGSDHDDNIPYHAYKLIGVLAVVAAVFVAVIAILFAGGGAAGMPVMAETSEYTASHARLALPAPEVSLNKTDDGLPALKSSVGSFVVCIDPGHGYDDPGALYKETMGDVPEKDVTLAVALMLRDKLEEAGLTVIMTREDDIIPEEHDGSGQYTLDPFERVDFVLARPETGLFISLHCDAFTEDVSVGGTRIYTYEGATDGTGQYAQTLSGAIGQALAIEVPIIQKDIYEAYWVTKKLPVPSLLVEMGFITNANDAQNLLSDDWRAEFVRATAAGIIEYVNSIN